MENDTLNARESPGSVLRPAALLFAAMTVVTGLLYPLAITGIAGALFPDQADGSLVAQGGHLVGSRLIGQSFTDPGHFWSRPSATAPQPYNGTASGGSNFGPMNSSLTDAVKLRIDALRAADPDNGAPIPVDLVTASGSGLDPEISLAAANYQAARVARVRHLSSATVRTLIAGHAKGSVLGMIGEPRVNVLELNLALDALK
jgi:potassium-transporting ATPase KdpC subunit